MIIGLCVVSTVMPRYLLLLWMCMLLGSAVADLDAEDRAELERLRAETKMLRTENAVLRAASSQQKASDDLVALLAETAEDSAEADLDIDASENATAKSKRSPTRSPVRFERGRKWSSKEQCDDRCNGNCWLPTKMFNHKCMMTSGTYASYLQGVVSVGTDQNPKWNIMGGEGYNTTVATVSCPCNHADGTQMSRTDAIRLIAGQVSAIGFPDWHARRSLGEKGDGLRWHGPSWLLRLSLATVKMVLCWKDKCEAAGTELTQDIQIDNDLDNMLKESSESAAGWNAC